MEVFRILLFIEEVEPYIEERIINRGVQIREKLVVIFLEKACFKYGFE